MIARIKGKIDKKETDDDGKTTEMKNVTRGDVMQAMRQKCNQLIFQTKRPTYHKGEITEKFFFLNTKCMLSLCHYRSSCYQVEICG